MFALLFLARKIHHIVEGKTARREVKKEADYHKRSDISIIL